MGKFTAIAGKEFKFTFDNGYTINIRIGYTNDCQNKNSEKAREQMCGSPYDIMIESDDCEVLIWDKDDRFVTMEIISLFDDSLKVIDSSVGYVKFNDWFKLMKFVEGLE